MRIAAGNDGEFLARNHIIQPSKTIRRAGADLALWRQQLAAEWYALSVSWEGRGTAAVEAELRWALRQLDALSGQADDLGYKLEATIQRLDQADLRAAFTVPPIAWSDVGLRRGDEDRFTFGQS